LSDLFQVDLLRERREQLGLPEPKAVNSQELLRKGILAGGVAVGLVLGLLGWFGFRLWSTRSAADALEPVSQQYVGLEQAVQGSRGRLKAIEQSNEGLVNEILSLPSSSALLTLMGRLTPPGVQLTDLSEKEGALVLKGEAADPQAFSRVETLMLQMAASPLFDKESIQLLKAERGKGEASQAAPQQAAAPATPAPAQPQTDAAQLPVAPLTPAPVASSVQFELNASFAKTAPKELVKEFLALGARGKALRVAQLQQEGLMP